MELNSKIYEQETNREIRPTIEEKIVGNVYEYTLHDNNLKLGCVRIDTIMTGELSITKIHDETQGTTTPCTGIGSALFEIAFRKSVELGKENDLKVNPASETLLFYYKNGFTVCANGDLYSEQHNLKFEKDEGNQFTYSAYQSYLNEHPEVEKTLPSRRQRLEITEEIQNDEDDEEFDCPYKIDENEKPLIFSHVLAYFSYLENQAKSESERKNISNNLKGLNGLCLHLSDQSIKDNKLKFKLSYSVSDALNEFEEHLKTHYKNKPPVNTEKFLEEARRICTTMPHPGTQKEYNEMVCAAIDKLATRCFSHRHYISRLLADIIFIPLGIVTLGAAFAVKSCFTGSLTFLSAKTHRREKLEEALGPIRHPPKIGL